MTLKRVLLISALAATATTQAVVIDTYPDYDGNVTSGWFKVGQSFIAPNVDNVLTSYKFALAPGSGNVQFSIFAFDGNGPTGSALFTTSAGWPGAGGDVLISNINLSLVSGNTYGAVVDLMGQSGPSVHFNGNQNSYNLGNGWWNDGSTWFGFQGLNMKFRAEFSPVPEPVSLIAVGLALASFSRRRKR